MFATARGWQESRPRSQACAATSATGSRRGSVNASSQLPSEPSTESERTSRHPAPPHAFFPPTSHIAFPAPRPPFLRTVSTPSMPDPRSDSRTTAEEADMSTVLPSGKRREVVLSVIGSGSASSGGSGCDDGAKSECAVGGGKASGEVIGGEVMIDPRRLKDPNSGETATLPWTRRVCGSRSERPAGAELEASAPRRSASTKVGRIAAIRPRSGTS